VEIKLVGEILIAISVINHYIKKTAKENLQIANVMKSMNKHGNKKNHNNHQASSNLINRKSDQSNYLYDTLINDENHHQFN
jgi:hypothetical protein